MTIPLVRPTPERPQAGEVAWLKPGEKISPLPTPPAEYSGIPIAEGDQYRPLLGREPLPSELPRPEAGS